MVAINRQDRGKGLSKLWRIFFFFYWFFPPSHFCLSNWRLCDKLLWQQNQSHKYLFALWWCIKKKDVCDWHFNNLISCAQSIDCFKSVVCAYTRHHNTRACNGCIPSLHFWFPHRLFKCHLLATILGTWIITFKLSSCLFYQPRIWLSMVPHLRVHSALAFWLLC